jgi:hypothetical protein
MKTITILQIIMISNFNKKNRITIKKKEKGEIRRKNKRKKIDIFC